MGQIGKEMPAIFVEKPQVAPAIVVTTPIPVEVPERELVPVGAPAKK